MTTVLDSFNREITTIYDQLVQQPEQDLDEFILNCERIIDQDLTQLTEYIQTSYDKTDYDEKDRLLIPTQVASAQDKVMRLNLAGFYKVLISWARARLQLGEEADAADLKEDDNQDQAEHAVVAKQNAGR